MPAATVFKDILKRWKDESRDLEDLLPREAASITEALAASVVSVYGPLNSNDRSNQAGVYSRAIRLSSEQGRNEGTQSISDLGLELESFKSSAEARSAAADEALKLVEQKRDELERELLKSKTLFDRQTKSFEAQLAASLNSGEQKRQNLEQRLNGLQQYLSDLKKEQLPLTDKLTTKELALTQNGRR
jgi:paraquat-inducible protein B